MACTITARTWTASGSTPNEIFIYPDISNIGESPELQFAADKHNRITTN
ncbi:hypothetical protein [Niabella drilacis]|nr:hypothetical protein [Niabella drilacis]